MAFVHRIASLDFDQIQEFPLLYINNYIIMSYPKSSFFAPVIFTMITWSFRCYCVDTGQGTNYSEYTQQPYYYNNEQQQIQNHLDFPVHGNVCVNKPQ
jgi:hypothetical protein